MRKKSLMGHAPSAEGAPSNEGAPGVAEGEPGALGHGATRGPTCGPSSSGLFEQQHVWIRPCDSRPFLRAGIAQHAQPLAIQFREGHMGSRGVRPASGTAYQRCPVQAAACMHKASVPGSAVAFSLPQSCPRRKFSGNTEIFLFQENFPETRKVQKCYQKSPNLKSGNLKI